MSRSSTGGVTVKDVSSSDFICALALHFKKSQKIELPEWHDLVKTAPFKELCPQDPDWYYVRAASMARKVYLRGGLGIGGFQKIYGGRQRNGSRPEHFALAAKGVHRHILHQLEKLELVEKKGDKKGRYITRQGRRELDTIANHVAQSKSKLKHSSAADAE